MQHKRKNFLHAITPAHLWIIFWIFLTSAVCFAVFKKPPLFISVRSSTHIVAGEDLLNPAVSKHFYTYYFPAGSIINAVIVRSNKQREFILSAIMIIAIMLSAVCAALMWSAECAILAAGFCFWMMTKSQSADMEQVILAVTLLALMCILAIKFKSEKRRSFFTGLGIAVSVYAKSVAVLFPVFLFIYDFFRRRKEKLLVVARDFLPIFAVPAAGLLIWIGAQYFSGMDVHVLERDRAKCNVVTGAGGLICTIEGDYAAMFNVPRDENVYLWAIKENLSHPIRQASAFCKRFWHVSVNQRGWWPFILFIFALLGALRVGGAVWLLPLYFIFVHCMMSVEERYFTPLWFMLCPLAGCSIGWIKPITQYSGRSKFFAPVAAVFSVPGFVFFCVGLWVLIVFPIKAQFYANPVIEAQKHPDNLWFNGRIGDYYFAAKMYEKAA
ncbi:MAG: hypothetical protein NTW04_00100, partial [Elusimicrobia bacterium]|nr:hypothetical protein [Elusimicrobiota bacterium]